MEYCSSDVICRRVCERPKKIFTPKNSIIRTFRKITSSYGYFHQQFNGCTQAAPKNVFSAAKWIVHFHPRKSGHCVQLKLYQLTCSYWNERLFAANGDFESVWKEHCSNTSLLRKYSTSMKELAVEHWGENNLRRMEWCKNVCVEYFFEGGCEKCLKKDCRRILFNLEQHQDCGCLPEAEDLRLKLNR